MDRQKLSPLTEALEFILLDHANIVAACLLGGFALLMALLATGVIPT